MKLYRCMSCGVLRILEKKPERCDLVYQGQPVPGIGNLKPQRCTGKYEGTTFDILRQELEDAATR